MAFETAELKEEFWSNFVFIIFYLKQDTCCALADC